MFDIGFWEILVIAVVLLLVMGPERLPEVAKQAAFLIRKARQGMFRLRSEMQSEMDGTPFADLQKAKQEINDFKKDITQLGRELADSAQQSKDQIEADFKAELGEADDASQMTEKSTAGDKIPEASSVSNTAEAKPKKKTAKKKTAKKKSKKVSKKKASTKPSKKKAVTQPT